MKAAGSDYRAYEGGFPAGVRALRDFRMGLTLVECTHAAEHRQGERCLVCHGEARFTDGFAWPVKFLAVAPKELTLL